MINVDYSSLLSLIESYRDPKRSESASFLIWYLENYYRLDSLDAVDAVCDQHHDKGVDGIYINQENGTIDIFQAKISQNPDRTVGDTVLKEFFGTLSQFRSKESIQNILDTSGDTLLVGLIHRLSLLQAIDQYRLRGIFISNMNIDSNGEAYLAITEDVEFIGKSVIEQTYISSSRAIPQNETAVFDVSDVNVSIYHVDTNTSAIIAPIKAIELVKMTGVADQSIYAYNVRGPLGGTNVNRGIEKSIKTKELHKKFPLFHNGITIVANKVENSSGLIKIETFFVVNGCQSLNTLYKNMKDLSDDLRILTKFIQVSVDSPLSTMITGYSNNQNGVKPRDFKSNNNIQVRLQNEFQQHYGTKYFFEIKRGVSNNELLTISNEMAGILLMSFDLKEPWGTHRKYQIFDDKYSEIFGRPEVTCHRILMLYLLDEVIKKNMEDITNKLVSKYALARYSLLFILRKVMEADDVGKAMLSSPEEFVLDPQKQTAFIKVITTLVSDIIIDFSGEVESLDEDFDYKSKLRDEIWVKKLSQEIVNTYLKQVNRGRIESLKVAWAKAIQ